MDKDYHDREAPWSRRESGIGISAGNSPVSPPRPAGYPSRTTEVHSVRSPDHSSAGHGSTFFFGDDENFLLFEDSGTFCPSIAEDSEEDIDDMDDLADQLGSRSLSMSSNGPSNPITIPKTTSDRCLPTSSAHVPTESRPIAIPQNVQSCPVLHSTPPRQPPQQCPGDGSLSMSPVVESLILRGMRNRLSGSFEEKCLRISGNIAATVDSTPKLIPLAVVDDLLLEPEPPLRSSSVCLRAAPEDPPLPPPRGRALSAPTVTDSVLMVRRRGVGTQLRSFGDQFNQAYKQRKASGSPGNYGNQGRLRRQVVSYPGSAKLNFFNAIIGKLP